MQVVDFTITNKGAGSCLNAKNQTTQFTYMVADEGLLNLHIFTSEKDEEWINCRDNGEAMNADANVINKLKKNKLFFSAEIQLI